jgi:hypothetical protein
MIVTEQIKLTSKELFSILITAYLKKRWWLVAWIWVMIILLLLRENNDSFGYYIAAALLFLQVIMIFQNWMDANNSITFLQERHYEIDSDKIVGITIDGSSTSFEVRHFLSVIKTSKYYLLYISKVDFLYFPTYSFKSIEDKEWFEREIVAKVKR